LIDCFSPSSPAYWSVIDITIVSEIVRLVAYSTKLCISEVLDVLAAWGAAAHFSAELSDILVFRIDTVFFFM